MKKRLITIMGIAVLTFALSASPYASAGTTIVKTGQDYSISSEFLDFLYKGEASLTIDDYQIKENEKTVFERIVIEHFYPKGEPHKDASERNVIAEGYNASVIVHSNPATTIDFESYVQNTASFTFSTDMGVIVDGSSLIVGNEEMRAEIIIRGEGNVTKNSMNEFVFSMEEDTSIFFRNNFVDFESIGGSIADGTIAGELFVTRDNYSVVDDLVEYSPISMETKSSSRDELKVEIDGDFDSGKVLIFDISKEVLGIPGNNLVVNFDDSIVEQVHKDDVLLSSGAEPKYALIETGEYLQVYQYAPSMSTHIVTFTTAELPYMEIMMGLGLAIAITAVSAFYLFRKRKEY
jgi:hypothetical protein